MVPDTDAVKGKNFLIKIPRAFIEEASYVFGD
jgi:hypothetical protein